MNSDKKLRDLKLFIINDFEKYSEKNPEKE